MTEEPNTGDVPLESALERIEAIVTEMEGDSLPLERLIDRYEEGMKLVEQAQKKLAAAEQRIRMIAKTSQGIELQEFEPGENS